MFYKRIWINRLSRDIFEGGVKTTANERLELANQGITRSSFFWLAANLKKTVHGVDHVRYGVGIETADGLETNHITTRNSTYVPNLAQEIYLKTDYLKPFFKDFAWVRLQNGAANGSDASTDKPHLTCFILDYYEIGEAFAELKREIKINNLRCRLLEDVEKTALRLRLKMERRQQDITDPKEIDQEAYHARRELARSMRGMYPEQAAQKPGKPDENPLDN